MEPPAGFQPARDFSFSVFQDLSVFPHEVSYAWRESPSIGKGVGLITRKREVKVGFPKVVCCEITRP